MGAPPPSCTLFLSCGGTPCWTSCALDAFFGNKTCGVFAGMWYDILYANQGAQVGLRIKSRGGLLDENVVVFFWRVFSAFVLSLVFRLLELRRFLV